VDDLSFEVGEGELVTLVGPSGCGKTTTMMMVNRLIEPTSGRIFVDGEDISKVDPVKLRRRIGYVIQQVGLFPHRTILDNTATVPALIGWKKSEARARAAELLDLVGLDPKQYGSRYPEQLSGGQRQRVGVARALAADPPVLLMDEPFGAVDPVVRTQLQDELLRLQKELNKTIVFVTHDVDEAVRLGDRIAIFRTGGHLVQCAPPAELLARPADDFVADFLGAERGLKLLSLKTLADVPQGPAPQGDWTLVLDAAGKPLHWASKDAELPVRPLGDDDSLLAAIGESIASPTGLVARVDAQGVLTGVSSRDDIHVHAGQAHTEARVVAA
jgi:osmoprotectant transport system ATP-binding protein